MLITPNVFLRSWMLEHCFLRSALTLSWRSSLSWRKQSIDLLCKSMDWLLYDREIRHEKVNALHAKQCSKIQKIWSFFVDVINEWPRSRFPSLMEAVSIAPVFNPLNVSPTKLSNTLKQVVGNSKRIVWVCLTILWDWHLKS